mmetsp:Transcript_22041/g.16443  ORF Transcript_22041/g.16443 Transcript_22041/m.16443 type:complete len:192 (+) Transcript_22041:895-1470(+)
MDTYAHLSNATPDQLKNRLRIQFMGEPGQDAGGLTREFYTELSREMFNPNYSLFILSSSGSTYYPNPKSGIQRDHLLYFKFIGRILGKALLDEQYLDCHFVKTLYKMLLGEPLDFSDLEDYDYEFYNNLKWCLNNDITPLGQNFTAQQENYGKTEEVELIKDGKSIMVDNENKMMYLEKLTFFKLYLSVSA